MSNSKVMLLIGLVTLIVAAFSCVEGAQNSPASPPRHLPPGTKSVVFAGGCFWCLDSLFEDLRGVIDVEAAYAGGKEKGVSYEEVCSGTTGHAEAVKVFYDPSQISESDLLHLFFASHNPTTLNRQGPDSGTQYRSVIFYTTPEEKELAEKVKADVERQKIWPDPIVTTIEPLKNYTPAEEYHQHYYKKYLAATPEQRAMMNGGYCAAIIQPHVLEFRQKYAKLLKKGS